MSNIDLVKKMNEACNNKDFDTIKSLLHPNYTLKDPSMQLNSAEEFIEFMKTCPFDGRVEASGFLEDGDKVVQIVDCVMTKPVAYRMHACDVLTFENGKLRSEEMFYDTKQIPQEAWDIVEKQMKKNAA